MLVLGEPLCLQGDNSRAVRALSGPATLTECERQPDRRTEVNDACLAQKSNSLSFLFDIQSRQSKVLTIQLKY